MVKKIFYLFGFIFLLIFTFFIFNKKNQEKINNKTFYLTQKTEEIGEILLPQPTKILPDGLPNKHLISTVFVPQAPEKNWDQPWQDSCEEAALLTVDYYYKNQQPSLDQTKTDILKMIDFEKSQGWAKDINTTQMAILSSNYLNYKTNIVTNPTIEEIKKYISQNIPVIVPANGKTLYKENRYFKSGGPYYHSVVILGYNDNIQKFIVHDVGTQFGAYFKYSYNLLLESNHDFPKSDIKEDIDSGPRNMLVLLK
ncbi:MAG: C39 family peptidase [Candidatus Shapirobacteria bacterium]|nr:C39 family peptidase [Candidatus Shapirobacteria bacterium]